MRVRAGANELDAGARDEDQSEKLSQARKSKTQDYTSERLMDNGNGQTSHTPQHNHSQEQEDSDRQYWRPNYMFHWLKETGKQINEAYVAFENYKGKLSYEELGLSRTKPLIQDEDDSSWSHMSDYDEFGLPTDVGQEDANCQKQDDANCQNCHRGNGDEPSEGESDAPYCEGSNEVRDHASGNQKEEDHVDYVHEIQTLKDDAHESNHNG